MWFNNWGHDLVQLGFATQLNDDGDIHIPDNQLWRIINFDETCLLLDGSRSRGGWPEVVFFNSKLLQLGKGTSKSSLATTMITFHLTFSFRDQQNQKTPKKLKWKWGLLSTYWCKFGMPGRRLCKNEIRLNEKGGMDDNKFSKYLRNSIIPLYPDVQFFKYIAF